MIYLLLMLYVKAKNDNFMLEEAVNSNAVLFDKINNLKIKHTNFRDIRKIIEVFCDGEKVR